MGTRFDLPVQTPDHHLFRLFLFEPMSKPRSIRSMLAGQGGSVERLLDRAHRLAELEKRVRAHLPLSLAPHCRIANLRAGILVIQTDSATWHTKLRFLLPGLTRRLREEPGLAELRGIELRVAPSSEPRQRAGRRQRLSEASAELLRSSAEATADPDLRRALQRLASRQKK